MIFLRRHGFVFSWGLLLLLLLFFAVACSTPESEVGSISGMDTVLAGQDLENLETFEDLQVGFTEEGFPFRGDPEAPITVIEFSDYLCPFCGRHTNETLPTLLDQYVRTGQVRFVFRDFPLDSLHPTADIGHAAALCVAEQGPVLYWRMHDQLFLRQGQWNSLSDPGDFLSNVAEEVGADMDAYEECLASGRKDEDVADSVAEGFALGFNATPSFQIMHTGSDEIHPFIGAQPVQEFAKWFDALASGAPPPVEPTPEPPQLPFWASTEGLAPDPARPGYTIAGDPYKGETGARTVVVEFSDFQCPACGQHALEVQPALDEALVDSGEAMWVMKHLPLRMHALAPIAATAAECAAEQGQFWEMHHLLFETQGDWAVAEADAPVDDAAFTELALELGLEQAAFESCFLGRSALERVLSDLYDAQDAGIRSTPTFVVVQDGVGTLLQRSMPPDEFISIVRDLDGTSESSS
jgi:protein-disulfide isomerase